MPAMNCKRAHESIEQPQAGHARATYGLDEYLIRTCTVLRNGELDHDHGHLRGLESADWVHVRHRAGCEWGRGADKRHGEGKWAVLRSLVETARPNGELLRMLL